MNPLLDITSLPRFSQIKPQNVEPAIDQVLAENRRRIVALLDATNTYNWDNLAYPMEEVNERLNRIWSPVNHMNAVVNTKELRAAFNACLPKLSDYATEVGQNERLFQAYKFIADSPEYTNLNTAQKKVIDNALRDFRLSGIELNETDKVRYKEIMQELSTLTSRFEENLLDATRAWSKHITDELAMSGLPASVKAMAKQRAEREEKTGWLFTLEFPSYLAIMTYDRG